MSNLFTLTPLTNDNAIPVTVDGKTAPTLNELELKSIAALVAYRGYDSGIHEDAISSLVASEFNVESVPSIARTHFDEAVRYLVDLDPKAVLN